MSPQQDGQAAVLYVGHVHRSASEPVDTVRFKDTVFVEEVRVLPSGFTPDQNRHLWLPFQGRTTPEQFKLECFINNVSDKGQGRFLEFGTLRYDGFADTDLLRDRLGMSMVCTQ